MLRFEWNCGSPFPPLHHLLLSLPKMSSTSRKVFSLPCSYPSHPCWVIYSHCVPLLYVLIPSFQLTTKNNRLTSLLSSGLPRNKFFLYSKKPASRHQVLAESGAMQMFWEWDREQIKVMRIKWDGICQRVL